MAMEKQYDLEVNVFNWIEEKLSPKLCTSEEFIYNEMESQSDFSLPIIYQPFDSTKTFHWTDRGALLIFYIQHMEKVKNYWTLDQEMVGPR